jgi:arginyl-tRNA synthetase
VGDMSDVPIVSPLLTKEKDLVVLLGQYSTQVHQAAQEQNPSVVAIYIYQLAKSFNGFYSEHSVMQAETDEKKYLRLLICQQTARVIADAMGLLGIRVPERM